MVEQSIYKRLSEFKSQEIEWLWAPFLGHGLITVMDGDPGVGKSFLAMHIAAVASVGGCLPNPLGEGSINIEKMHVSYLTSEDDPSFTIRPRIEAMGGDPGMIRVQDRFSPFDERGLEDFRRDVRRHRPGLIVIDPLYGFMDPSVDIFRSNHVRAFLSDVQDIANDIGAAVLVIRHLRKAPGEKALYQGAGSMDVIGVARVGLVVGEDPDDEYVKVIAHSKHNLSPRAQSLTFTIEAGEGRLPYFKWGHSSELTADQLTAGGRPKRSAVEEAIEFLEKELTGGARKASEIEDKADREGISPRTLDRAKKALGVVSKKRRDGWDWYIPKNKREKASPENLKIVDVTKPKHDQSSQGRQERRH